MKGQSRFFLTIAWNFKIKRFWHKLFASLKRKILTNESSLLQTFLLWVLYLGCGRNSRQKAGGERGALDKKLFLLQIVRYKVASVNKTVQTYQQGDFSARHVTSLQTTLQGANVRERAHITSPSPLQHTTNSPQMYNCTYVCRVKMCPLEQYEYAGRLSKFQVPQFAEFEKKPIEAAPYISHLSPVRNWIFNMIFCLAAQIVFSFKFIPLGISSIIIMI